MIHFLHPLYKDDPAPSAERTGAEDIHWNLADLYADEATLRSDLQAADTEAQAFAETYHRKIRELSASELAEAMRRLETIHDKLGRAYTYAYLHWVTNTEDPKRGKLLQMVKEAYTQTSQKLIFFDLEWAHLAPEKAEKLLGDKKVQAWRHYLELLRIQKDYMLTEPEEKIMSEKNVTGRSAWVRYFDEVLGAARFDLRGETLTEQEVLAKLHSPDRELRKDAAASLTDGLQKHLRTLTYVFNTVLADKATDDRLRGYPNWLSSRNISNEIADHTVDALVGAVTSRYDLVARFYRLKQKLLGYDTLHDYDRYAPVGDADTFYSWNDARDIVLDAYDRFHPDMGRIVKRFFDDRWIDAAVVPGKRGGAFSHGAVPSAHPYILMNYTGRVRDVQTLAHELGHGVHQYLSRSQGVFQSDTPLTTAETASVFGEMLVFEKLIAQERDPKNRLAMLVAKIDDSMATVFRQVTMNRFEDRAHSARREQGELTPEQLSDFWMQTQQAMYAGSVTLLDHYRIWWSYIPHFLHTPGYVYAYAFGELLVLALYQRYRDEGDPFTKKYIELLGAGGSDWPHVLVNRLGVDITDPNFWQQGLEAIERLVVEAEELAAGNGNRGTLNVQR